MQRTRAAHATANRKHTVSEIGYNIVYNVAHPLLTCPGALPAQNRTTKSLAFAT